MKHVYLSPHLDDAVLSCGATIHRQVAAGEGVRVITICAGDPPAGPALSPFALIQHMQWGDPPQPMALRRAEDLAALTLLGAEAYHLDDLDAVYRAGPGGQWLYTDLDALFGPLQAGDPLAVDGSRVLAGRLATLLADDADGIVYAPLGVGRHVDHQAVHAAARLLEDRGYRLAYYEDYPYAEREGAVEAARSAAGAMDWAPEACPLDAADLAAKVSAVGYYRSQLPVLFGGAEAMAGRVWAFAAAPASRDGLAERIWWPKGRDPLTVADGPGG